MHLQGQRESGARLAVETVCVANHAVAAVAAVYNVVAGAIGVTGIAVSVAIHTVTSAAAVHDVVAGTVGVVIAAGVADDKVAAVTAVHNVAAGAVGDKFVADSVAEHTVVAAAAIHG